MDLCDKKSQKIIKNVLKNKKKHIERIDYALDLGPVAVLISHSIN